MSRHSLDISSTKKPKLAFQKQCTALLAETAGFEPAEYQYQKLVAYHLPTSQYQNQLHIIMHILKLYATGFCNFFKLFFIFFSRQHRLLQYVLLHTLQESFLAILYENQELLGEQHLYIRLY